MNKFKLAGVGVVLIVALIIVIQNRESVETQLLFVSVTMPRAALLFVAMLVGFFVGVLTTWSVVSKSRKESVDEH